MLPLSPYPGLRPFNEEESIFFKGREQQVERIVKRLEEKKFLMVNGASGDGKSSLIFAGVIPFAKAGFFKAKYNNWLVADFRPERAPLKNLTASVCRQLKIENTTDTEKKIGYGFSALCDLYKASPFYIDESKSDWLNADDAQKKALKRKGANLLVLVDQFEEFFTNPENYSNGVPSLESQKTVNLLLETYKLAAAQNLPIYVVCTMRSDYIGQCAAFRGLPEAIGYSQFFVPRLKRQEIEQVIEGPAELAGGKISKRLTQTLINNLTEGFDQLPILQHALNHVWKMAGNGAQELDLIHLAQVGGVSPKALPIEDRQKFNLWFDQLPEYKKQLFENPSLSNVLNAHANELYLTAHLHFKEKFGEEISIEQSQKIIKGVFTCLTKMDTGRAVRNRMTLEEITHIINDEQVSSQTVDRLLSIYREQGNTFLQPFIDAEESYKALPPHQVLDITHESLIRNWTQLNQWAIEEYEHLQNYLDFSKQLDRWVNHNYSSGFLLPIGPLTFFESWFEKLNPNKYWILRYKNSDKKGPQKAEEAEFELSKMRRFISKSSKKLFFTRTLLKYGGNKVAAFFGLLFLFSSITFYYYDYRQKQNDVVLSNILTEGRELLLKQNVKAETKAKFIINYDRLYPGNYKNLFEEIKSDTSRFEIAKAAFQHIAENGFLIENKEQSTQKEYGQSIIFGEIALKAIINYYKEKKANTKNYYPTKDEFEKTLKGLRLSKVILDNHPNKEIELLRNSILSILESQINKFLESPKRINEITYKLFHEGIEWQLSFSTENKKFASIFVKKIACFDRNQAKFRKIFPNTPFIAGYMGSEKITDQAAFYILAKAYAVLGEKESYLKCLDSLINKNPSINDYDNFNPYGLFFVWLKENSSSFSDNYQIANYYSKISKVSFPKLIFEYLDLMLFPEKSSPNSVYSHQQDGYFPINNTFVEKDIITICKMAKSISSQYQNKDSVHFRKAEYYKMLGFYFGLKNKNVGNLYFDSLRMETNSISTTFLNQKYTTATAYSSTSVSVIEYLFIPFYFDQNNFFWPIIHRNSNLKETTVFFDYLVKNWAEINKTHSISSRVFDFYLAHYNNLKNWWYNNHQANPQLLDFLFDFKASTNSIGIFKSLDTNYFNILVGNCYFKLNDLNNASRYIEYFSDPGQFEKVFPLERWTFRIECMNTYRTEFGKYLALKGDTLAFENHLSKFRTEAEKKNLLSKCILVLLQNENEISAFYYLKKLNKFINAGSSYPNKLLLTNIIIGGSYFEDFNNKLLKEVPDNLKANAKKNIISGYARIDKYYKAYKEIPSFSSNTSRLWYINTILWNRCKNMEKDKLKWKDYDFMLDPETSKDYVNTGDYGFGEEF
jgi:hypothetical protein